MDWNVSPQRYQTVSETAVVHLFQSSIWSEITAAGGWTPIPVIANGGPLLLLRYPLPCGLSAFYSPRGPTGLKADQLISVIEALLPRLAVEKAVFWRLDPFYPSSYGVVGLDRRDAAALFQRRIKPKLKLVHRPILPNPLWRIQIGAQTGLHQCHRGFRKVSLEAAGSQQNLKILYALLKEKASKRKTRLQSYRVFSKTVELFQRQGLARLVLARSRGQVLGGSLTVLRHYTAYNLYLETRGYLSNCDPSAELLRDALGWAASQKATELEFARTSPGEGYIWKENPNLLRDFGATGAYTPGEMDVVLNPAAYHLLRIVRPLQRWALA